MEGFIVLDHADEYGSMLKELAQWLSEGKIKRTETIVKGGLKQAEEALAGLFKGQNTGTWHMFYLTVVDVLRLTGTTGKLLVEVKNPEEPSKL